VASKPSKFVGLKRGGANEHGYAASPTGERAYSAMEKAMNKRVFIIIAAMFMTVATVRASDFDFVPYRGFCAIGRIAQIHEGQSQWSIELVGIKILLQNSNVEKMPSKNEIFYFDTGLGGVMVDPDSSWIGKMALFSGICKDGKYIIPYFPPLALSPDLNIAVFDADETSDIQAIEKVVQILKLENNNNRLNGLTEIVESSAKPLFIRRFAIQQVAKMGREAAGFNAAIRLQLLRWRENRLGPELQVCADEELMNHSPIAYQWSEDRIEFLRKIQNKSEASDYIKAHVSQRLNEAERKKSEKQ
jgi:hypothetical protein